MKLKRGFMRDYEGVWLLECPESDRRKVELYFATPEWHKTTTVKSVCRRIRKSDLPVGTMIMLQSKWIGYDLFVRKTASGVKVRKAVW